MRRRLLAAGALALLATAPAWAVGQVDQPLNDPALEARANDLAREIRCVVCENEPVANSSAEIAIDMRQAIRERVAAGDSDDQVRAYFASRYGEFVLLRPRFSAHTLILWATPLALLLLAGVALVWRARRPAPPPPRDTEADALALAALARHEERGRAAD